ncbi:two-partner secretion domain-containing protein [Parathermosynechococcus lividus]
MEYPPQLKTMHHRSLWVSLLCAVGTFLPASALGQIIADPNGTGTHVTQTGQQFDIGGGTFSGNGHNLFHLFRDFGLSQGQIANFLSNPHVRNILAGVNGGNASYINGLIQVSGGTSNLYLMNPAGIVFGPSARLNVPAAFHASTASRVHFEGGVFDLFSSSNTYATLLGNPTGFEFNSKGILINEGHLRVKDGQQLTLMAHQVMNTGTLAAPGGSVTVQAVPETGMVRVSQDGMILSLEIPRERITGEITAVDLPTLLTGGTPEQRVNSVIHNPDGSIALVHDPNKVSIPMQGATAVVGGTIDVSHPTGVGGHINVLANNNIAVVGASLTASGTTGGGTVLVGGDYLGGTTGTNRLDSSLNAQHLFVDSNTVMNADAVTQGNGGTVINWADNSTVFHGFISARGGELGGNGGFAEVSGRETLHMSGFADLRAPQGTFGTLLLDPGSVTIQNGTGTNTGPNSFDDGYLNTQLGSASVIIATSAATNGNPETITIAGDTNINWSAPTTLTLTAGQNIVMDPGAVIQNTHTGTSFDAIVFNANTAGTTTGNFVGIQLSGATLSAASGNITLTGHGGNTGTQNYGIYQLNAAQVSSTSGNVTYEGTGGNGTSLNYGIYLFGANTTITSGTGAIALTGIGQGNGTGNRGISQEDGAQVSSTGGNITYSGTGGNGTGSNHGIVLTGANTTITSENGAIALTGTGRGNQTDNYGIYQLGAAQVRTTGTGTITYTGTGGNGTNNNYGIYLFGANTTITSENGAIALTGTGQGNGAGNRGISQESGAQVSSTSGTITYTGTGANGAEAILTQSGTNRIGHGTTGNITLISTNNAITLDDLTVHTTGNLQINSLDNVAQNANTSLQATGLELLGTGNFTLSSSATNAITTLAGHTTGTISYRDSDGFTIGTVGMTNGLTSGGAITLHSDGAVTQTQPIVAQGLAILGTGDTELTNPNNNIGKIAADTTGNLTVVNSGTLTVDTVNPDGIESANNVLLRSLGGNIVLNQGITATGDITLVAAQNFINNAGFAPLVVGSGGRWLVYATSPQGNVNGWSVMGGSQQFSTTYPTVPGFAGNGFIYSSADLPPPPVPPSPPPVPPVPPVPPPVTLVPPSPPPIPPVPPSPPPVPPSPPPVPPDNPTLESDLGREFFGQELTDSILAEALCEFAGDEQIMGLEALANPDLLFLPECS